MSKYTEAFDSIYEVFHKPKEIQRQLLKMFPKDAKEEFPTERKGNRNLNLHLQNV